MKIETWRDFMLRFWAGFYAEYSATNYYEYVKLGGDLPIRLKNQQPPRRRLADTIL